MPNIQHFPFSFSGNVLSPFSQRNLESIYRICCPTGHVALWGFLHPPSFGARPGGALFVVAAGTRSQKVICE
jgi:hypothetical protein